ncbi:two-component system regulatory protein YycI [uncultured Rummeliibacillus sp.]|uniref:two-component system regulatory protein YycI n=1 Tax=uncultured Rummeliibacillus sp. TaxID=762292 RepID=UPI0026205149|nr:two-component system regulatory protein YycI [uncultured Rummeliibacillus sp.]
MDWNKTKTIFIIVFSILNVFLYTMYVNRYNEAKMIEPIGNTDISTRLKDENITVKSSAVDGESVSYISGKVKQFTNKELTSLQNLRIQIINGGTEIQAKITKLSSLPDITDELLSDFVRKQVYKGSSYKLWKVNKKDREAIFFQISDDYMIYYNQNATVKVHWNDRLEITDYEQKMFDSLKSFGEKSTLIKAQRAIEIIFDNGYLPANSTVSKTQLGYSTLVPLTETQVLCPTWYIHIILPKDVNGERKEADYFVNAVDGTIVDIEQNVKGKELEKQ